MKNLMLFSLLLLLAACSGKKSENGRTPILEVEGRFLYKDEIESIIPLNSSILDSTDIANRYIKKWITDVLMYENAKRNIGNLKEIDKLVEEYRKSLIIHEYEQALVSERIPSKVSEQETKEFYEKYKSQFVLEDNVIQGMLLIVPTGAPQLEQVKQWVRVGDTKSLENIENYSLQNAISFDYFADTWTPFSEITKKTPFQPEDSRLFVLNNRFSEVSDSTRHYLLRIYKAIPMGDVEPYEYAKERIASTILNKKKSEFIINFEKNVYEDAIKSGDVNFFK